MLCAYIGLHTGSGTEGVVGRTSLGRPFRPLFHFLCESLFTYTVLPASSHIHSAPACQSGILGKIGKKCQNLDGTILHISVLTLVSVLIANTWC